jgi:hypothetical protein
LYVAALADLHISPLILFQLRPCADVIRSLAARDGLDADISELLWIRSIVEAEQATRGYPRAWATVDQLCADWRATIRSVMPHLGLATARITDEAGSRIDRFINPELLQRKPRRTEAPRWLVLNLWNAAQQALAGDEAGAQAAFDVTASALADFDRLQARTLSRVTVRYQAELDALYGSTSWRLTRPLRALKRRMTGAHSV